MTAAYGLLPRLSKTPGITVTGASTAPYQNVDAPDDHDDPLVNPFDLDGDARICRGFTVELGD